MLRSDIELQIAELRGPKPVEWRDEWNGWIGIRYVFNPLFDWKPAPLDGNLALLLLTEARLNVGPGIDGGWTAITDADLDEGSNAALAMVKYQRPHPEESIGLAWIDWKKKQKGM